MAGQSKGTEPDLCRELLQAASHAESANCHEAGSSLEFGKHAKLVSDELRGTAAGQESKSVLVLAKLKHYMVLAGESSEVLCVLRVSVREDRFALQSP